MKDEYIRFRVTKDKKEKITARAKELNPNQTVTDYIETLIDTDMQRTEDVVAGECPQSLCVHFSLPDQYGVTCYIGSDQYSLFPQKSRLTDDFLSILLESREKRDLHIELFTDRLSGEVITLDFGDDVLVITQNGFSKKYPVSLKDFTDDFINHVKKFAIYFAAPCNYKAIFFKPFDQMVEKMKTYQSAADMIVKKIDDFF